MSASEVTAITESAQALFCSMADYLGLVKAKEILNLTKYPTYKSFLENKSNEKLVKDNFKNINTPGITLQSIEKILSSENKSESEWYKSSVNIAIKLLQDIQSIDSDFTKIKAPNWQDIFYYRGEKTGSGNVMIDISKLFSIANKKDKIFGDINKWSSADIYLASTKAKKEIAEQINMASSSGYNFINLNKFVNKLISSGDLLGVSLKKSPVSVGIYRVNFTESENEKLLSEIHYFDINTKNPRDMTVYIGNSKAKPFIQIRHDATSATLSPNEVPVIKTEIIGKASRLGSLTSFGTANPSGTGLTDLWARVDTGSAANLLSAFQTGFSSYRSGISALNVKYAKLVKAPGTTGAALKIKLKEKIASDDIIKASLKLRGLFDFDKVSYADFNTIKKLKPSLYEVYKNDRINLSQLYVINPIKKKFIDFFGTKGSPKHQLKKDNVCLEWYKYASAMSPSSGRFVIAK